MLKIDGNKKSGSGTILRLALALAGILNEPLHIYNIRKKRSKPGLRPQHLAAVITAAKICDAKLAGATLGSQEIRFEPSKIKGGMIHAEIGTAGSISMLMMTVLPIAAYAQQPLCLNIIKGGTDVQFSPPINYLKHILLPVLQSMNLEASIEVKKYGYYPKGMGEATLEVKPTKTFSPFNKEEFGVITDINGISVCTNLADRRVSERQADEAKRQLLKRGYRPEIEVVNDFSNPFQKGSSIVLWVKTDTGVHFGSDALGEPRKPSERVGLEVTNKLLNEINADATVDIHLANMLIPFMALADGESQYLTRLKTDHIESNLWLVSEVLGIEFTIRKKGNIFRICKVS